MFGKANDTELETPCPFLSVTVTAPVTVPPSMPNGSRNWANPPKAVSPVNHCVNIGATSRVRVLPDTEQPARAPQLKWTFGTVSNDRFNCVTSRDVENKRIETSSPPSVLVWMLWIVGAWSGIVGASAPGGRETVPSIVP